MNAVVQALCAVMVGQASNVDWTAFAPCEWELLAETGHDQGVLPLIAHAFDGAGWPVQMPPRMRATIQAAHYIHAAQNSLFCNELKRIMDALAPVSPVIVLKGAALGPTVYAHVGLRPLSDLDLLVPHERLQAVGAALHELGYAAAHQPALAGSSDIVDHHLCLQGGPGQHVTVEVHWRLIGGAADWRSPDHAWFWQHTERRQLSVGGHNQTPSASPVDTEHVLHLTPTAHLLYLAAHLMLQHGGAQARLIWLYDLHLLLTCYTIDWNLLIKQAHAFRWAAALHGALQGAQQFFGSPVPPHVLDALDVANDPSATAFVHHKASTKPRSVRSAWLDLHALRRPTRVWWLWHVVCPAPAYMRWRYRHWPVIGWLWPLSYPYRWARALAQALHWLVERRKTIASLAK